MAKDGAVTMKASKQQDSRALMMQARRKQKSKLPLVQKWMSTISPLNVLLDSLEAYDQVLSCYLKGMMYLCTVSDLQSVLKVNGFQCYHMTKDYIEKNLSILKGVLFQTRFSSLITGKIAITAVALEESEVEEDLAALQWRDEASKGLVMSPPEVDCSSEVAFDCLADDPESATANSSSKTPQPADILPFCSDPNKDATDLLELSADDCYRPDMSMVEMQESMPYFCQGPSSPPMYIPDPRNIWPPQEEISINLSLSEPEVELLTQPISPVLCLEEQLRQSLSRVSSFDYTGSASQQSSESEEQVVYPYSSISQTTTEMVDTSDARAKPESEDVMEKFAPFTPESPSSIICSTPFTSGEVLSIPDQSHDILSLQAKNPETEQLTKPSALVSDLELVSEIEAEEHSSHSSVPTAGFGGQPARSSSSPLSKCHHTAIASQEICEAVANSESVEKFDLIEKFAMEALQLNVHHNVLEGEGLLNLEVLHETTSERDLPVVANFANAYIRLEEDQSSNSCKIQEMHRNSPLYVMPIPQQQASYTSFVGLLAEVSAGHSGALKDSICTFEEQNPMFNIEAKSCAKRLFTEDEAKSSEGEDITSARSPRKT